MSTEFLSTPLLSLKEAAALLGCSTDTVRRAVQGKRIRYFQERKHGTIKFAHEWLKDYIEAGSNHEPDVPRPRTRKPKKPVRHIESRFGFDPALLNI